MHSHGIRRNEFNSSSAASPHRARVFGVRERGSPGRAGSVARRANGRSNFLIVLVLVIRIRSLSSIVELAGGFGESASQ
jgi:hypothetical protein